MEEHKKLAVAALIAGIVIGLSVGGFIGFSLSIDYVQHWFDDNAEGICAEYFLVPGAPGHQLIIDQSVEDGMNEY